MLGGVTVRGLSLVGATGVFVQTNTQSTMRRYRFDGQRVLDAGEIVYDVSKWLAWLDVDHEQRRAVAARLDPDDVIVVDLVTGVERVLTDNPARDRAPVFTADGSAVVFMSNRGGALDLWRVNVDGSGMTQLTDSGGKMVQPVAARDGRSVYFTEHGSLRSLDLTQPLPVKSGRELPFAGCGELTMLVSDVSRDGRAISLSCLAGPASQRRVVILDSETAATLAATDEATPLLGGRFVGDDNALVFDDGGRLWLWDWRNNERTELLRAEPGVELENAVVRGEWLYVLFVRVSADLWRLTVPPAR